jgi:hypothetical protein
MRLTRPVQFLLGACALALAAPAAAFVTPTDQPPVEGGDMGCFIALGVVGLKAQKDSENTALSQADRDKARQLDLQTKSDGDWFMARVSTWPLERRNGRAFFPLFGKYGELKDDQLATIAGTCSKWVYDRKTQLLDEFQK